MISKEEFMKIKVLAMQGMSQRAIAKQLGTYRVTPLKNTFMVILTSRIMLLVKRVFQN